MIQTEHVSKIKKLTDIKKLHPRVNLSLLALNKKVTYLKKIAFGIPSRKMKKAV